MVLEFLNFIYEKGNRKENLVTKVGRAWVFELWPQIHENWLESNGFRAHLVLAASQFWVHFYAFLIPICLTNADQNMTTHVRPSILSKVLITSFDEARYFKSFFGNTCRIRDTALWQYFSVGCDFKINTCYQGRYHRKFAQTFSIHYKVNVLLLFAYFYVQQLSLVYLKKKKKLEGGFENLFKNYRNEPKFSDTDVWEKVYTHVPQSDLTGKICVGSGRKLNTRPKCPAKFWLNNTNWNGKYCSLIKNLSQHPYFVQKLT